ncbi:hypothetical protein GCM10010294_51940 [Streptomyces griseoloalbus]|nr:hypothetical protein GCM10010294_51940 [Streptomyces griseoloalbus]
MPSHGPGRKPDDAVAPLPTVRDRGVEGFVVALRRTRAHPLCGGLPPCGAWRDGCAFRRPSYRRH